MSHRVLPVTAILAVGIGLGLAGDHLLRASGGPGLNFFLLFAGLAASAWHVARRGESPLGREALSWIGVGILCGAALLWRGSGLLRFWTFVAACTAFALPALDAGRAWVRRAGILEVKAQQEPERMVIRSAHISKTRQAVPIHTKKQTMQVLRHLSPIYPWCRVMETRTQMDWNTKTASNWKKRLSD